VLVVSDVDVVDDVADLQRCTERVDVRACPKCDGRDRDGDQQDPVVYAVGKMTHLGLPTEIPPPRPPPRDLFGWS